MFGLKIVKESDINYWKSIEGEHNSKCKQVRMLNHEIDRNKNLEDALVNKIHGTRAVVFDIKKDKEGNTTYICVKDTRNPFLAIESGEIWMEGNVEIFALSPIVHPSRVPEKIIDMPYLQATFRKEYAVIDELHSDIDNDKYENLGYATMLVETLIAMAKKAGCTYISGMLSDADAKTEERKEKRNEFYKKRGFACSFTDEKEESGNIRFDIK